MAKNRKNIIIRIQDWIESVPGQTFLNYAYSWGAAVVILGALFKLTHIPGANAMLFIGMGTEVLVFFISGFDRPAELKRDEDRVSLASDEEDWDEEAVGEKEAGNLPEVAQGPTGCVRWRGIPAHSRGRAGRSRRKWRHPSFRGSGYCKSGRVWRSRRRNTRRAGQRGAAGVGYKGFGRYGECFQRRTFCESA